ncbi:UTP--glucose-1-phosphate uridylyltransferase GalU [soil metagenome]
MPAVTTAVVPVAGLGTRLLPATKSQPKEMLPVGGKPVVQHVVEELAAAAIERVVFVTGRGKSAIENHFDRDPTLTGVLARRGDAQLLGRLAFERLGLAFAYTRQPEPLGLGDAVLCAEGFTGDAPFAVALGDAILGGVDGPPPVVARLAAALERHGADCAVAVRNVAREHSGRYGIVSADSDGDGKDGVVRVEAIVEKPDPATAPSTLAVAARYVTTPAIFDALRATPRAVNGELELTDAIARLIDDGRTVVAVRLRDIVRHDIGTHESYASAFMHFALADPDHGARLRAEARALLDDDNER